MINNSPIAVFNDNGSPKNITDKIIVIAMLDLSTGATCDTLPSCSALK